MTTKKQQTTEKGKVKKLKFRKETIRDLDVQGKARQVQGGMSGAKHCNE